MYMHTYVACTNSMGHKFTTVSGPNKNNPVCTSDIVPSVLF